MKKLLQKRWLLRSLKGLLAIIFGLIALFFPRITLVTLAFYFGIFAILAGLFMTIGAFRIRQHTRNWYLWLIEGIFDILIGLFIVTRPEISVSVFLIIIGLWAIIMGLVLIVSYYRVHKIVFQKRNVLFAGIIALLFGILILWHPFGSGVVITALIGIFAIAYGSFTIITAIQST